MGNRHTDLGASSISQSTSVAMGSFALANDAERGACTHNMQNYTYKDKFRTTSSLMFLYTYDT